MYQTDQYEGMIAETVTMPGHQGQVINAYFARPLGPGPFPGMVIVHHMPGWDEWYREAARKFAHHGYATISPNLYFREGHGTPEDVAAKARASGGVADDQAVGDIAGAMAYLRSLPILNGKVESVAELIEKVGCFVRRSGYHTRSEQNTHANSNPTSPGHLARLRANHSRCFARNALWRLDRALPEPFSCQTSQTPGLFSD